MKNVIDITINDKEDFYNKFDNTKLSEELGNYIHNQSLAFSSKYNYTINIKTDFELSHNEEVKITDMIREFFGLTIKEYLIYNKSDNIKRVILTVLGILLICFSHFVEISNEFIISEVFLIIGWGAIWEVFDNMLLSNTKKNHNLASLKRLVKSKIVFIKNDGNLDE